ncbi:hypothetical protein TNCV_1702291 [Trichonephila clavipes]|nr:hypothetical protein TNCV_1702291 [Trichonephila clavipes]
MVIGGGGRTTFWFPVLTRVSSLFSCWLGGISKALNLFAVSTSNNLGFFFVEASSGWEGLLLSILLEGDLLTSVSLPSRSFSESYGLNLRDVTITFEGERLAQRKIEPIYRILRTERPEGKRFSEAVLRLNSASEKKSVLLKKNRTDQILRTELLEGKEIFGSRAVIEFSFGEEERLAQKKKDRTDLILRGASGVKEIFGSSAAIELIFEAVPRVNSRLAKLTTLIVRGGKFKIGQKNHCS